jgi:hypothetical protein
MCWNFKSFIHFPSPQVHHPSERHEVEQLDDQQCRLRQKIVGCHLAVSS